MPLYQFAEYLYNFNFFTENQTLAVNWIILFNFATDKLFLKYDEVANWYISYLGWNVYIFCTDVFFDFSLDAKRREFFSG